MKEQSVCPRYALLEISLHGLKGASSAEEIRARAERALREEFYPGYSSDIEVEVTETAP